jgi:hypothetical protein
MPNGLNIAHERIRDDGIASRKRRVLPQHIDVIAVQIDQFSVAFHKEVLTFTASAQQRVCLYLKLNPQ